MCSTKRATDIANIRHSNIPEHYRQCMSKRCKCKKGDNSKREGNNFRSGRENSMREDCNNRGWEIWSRRWKIGISIGWICKS